MAHPDPLAQPDLQALLDLLVHLVQQDMTAQRAILGIPVLPVQLVPPVQLVLPAPLEAMEKMVRPGRLGLRALLVHQVPPVLQVLRDLRVLEATTAKMALRGRLGLQVLKALLERTVLQVLRDLLDPLVLQVPQALPEKTAARVPQGTTAALVQQVLPVLQELLAPRGKTVALVLQGLLGQLAMRVLLGRLAMRVLLGWLALRVLLDQLALRVQRALRVLLDRLASKAIQDPPDLQALQVLLERMVVWVLSGHQVRLPERMASKARRARPGSMAKMDGMGKTERMALPDHQGHQDALDPPGHVVRLERKGNLALVDHVVHLERMGKTDILAILGHVVHLERKGNLALLGHAVHLERKGNLDHVVHLERKGKMDILAILGHAVRLERKGNLDLLGHAVRLALLVRQADLGNIAAEKGKTEAKGQRSSIANTTGPQTRRKVIQVQTRVLSPTPGPHVNLILVDERKNHQAARTGPTVITPHPIRWTILLRRDHPKSMLSFSEMSKH